MWIHGGFAGNPLYDKAIQLGEPLSQEVDYFSSSVFSTTNQPLPPGWELRTVVWRRDIINRINDLRDNPALNSPSQDVPIYKVYQDYVVNQSLTQENITSANLLVHSAFQVLLNGNITQLSALRYGDAKTLPAVDVHLKNGFDVLVNSMLPGLDIRLSSPVASVVQGSNGVSLTTADGQEYQGSYVITTQSLGTLKERGVQFTPPLPPEKLDAIAGMGFGVFDKVILVFDSAFWGPGDFVFREMNDLTGDWDVFLSYNRTLNMPVLVALNVADTARRLENATDEELLAAALGSVRAMYGAAVPQPRQYYVTRWASDPWSRGSYSYFAVGNPKNITAALAEPVGRLLFAGEATSDHPATVLGAYESGLREGERVAKLLGTAQQNITKASQP